MLFFVAIQHFLCILHAAINIFSISAIRGAKGLLKILTGQLGELRSLNACLVHILDHFYSLTLSLLGLPQRELKITDKEVYEAALDLEYKKYEEVKNSNNQSLVTLRRIKNGIARLSGEKVPSTDSPSQSPSTSPSPAITSGPEGEDPATPGPPDLGTGPGKEQGLADKENVRTTRGRERKVNKNVRKLPPI